MDQEPAPVEGDARENLLRAYGILRDGQSADEYRIVANYHVPSGSYIIVDPDQGKGSKSSNSKIILASPYSDLLWPQTWKGILARARQDVKMHNRQIFQDLRRELGLPFHDYRY